MLIPDDKIRCDHLYMGPGKGCRQVIRYDEIGFRKALDCDRLHESRAEVVDELQATVFQAFRTGTYQFEPSERQALAEQLIGLSHADLIDRMYARDHFEREFVRRELIRREILDEDIYRIGLFGNDLAVVKAIELMKAHAERLTREEDKQAPAEE